MKFTCQRAGELLLDFLELGLPAEEDRQMVAHLEICRPCAKLLRTYAATTKMCAAVLRKEIPEGASERLLTALRRTLQKNP